MMFVETQPWQNGNDYKQLVQNLNPPPPPTDETEWELHFCKWWGWNWVKKKEVQEALCKKSMAPGARGKKPEKKPIRELCNSLCFKNRKEERLQKMYNTPSNSMMGNKKVDTSGQSLQNMYNTPSNSVIEERQKKTMVLQNAYRPQMKVDSSLQEGAEAQVSKEVRKELYTTMEKKTMRKQWSSSSSDECCACKNGSSTEESVEYINITCCPCCHQREPEREPLAIKKTTKESYTQGPAPRSKITSTQTEEVEKKRKKRRICVVCCSCGRNQPRCCICDRNEKYEERRFRKCRDVGCCRPEYVCTCGKDVVEEKVEKEKETKLVSEPLARKTEAARTEKKPPPKKKCQRKCLYEPLYISGMPIDTMLYYNKPMTKFGLPSQNYSWIHATKSDIWDQFSHLKFGSEFSSPVSGKTYNISPIKVNDIGSEPSVLLNPISVEEELQSLKKIESDVRMDLKSRILLDAVCDSILAKDREPSANSSIFLNEFTYPSNITQTECLMKNAYQPEEKFKCSKLNQTCLDELIFEETSYMGRKKMNRETNTVSCSSRNASIRDYTKAHVPQAYITESPCRRINEMRFNYERPRECLRSVEETENRYKLAEYDRPFISIQTHPPLTRTGLMPTYKRSASSPTRRPPDIKKAKLREPCARNDFKNTNIADIFKKIDEIVLRSKVNNEEIQNVLNAIPKRTFQFFTSWEMPNQSPTLRITEQGNTSSMNSIEEETSESYNKPKMMQSKKKKVVNRPSLIPKRVNDSKLNKRSLNT